MQMMLAACVSLLLAACSGPEPVSKVDRVELRVSGWSAVDIDVNSSGKGQYHLSDPLPNGRGGSFSIEPQQFTALVERLHPYEQKAVPVTHKSAQEIINRQCPKGVPFVTDAGGVWIHWVGPRLDRHYFADFGCDEKRNADRNKELFDLVKSLPVPLDW